VAEWLHAHLKGLVLYDSRLFNRTSNVGRWAASVARTFEVNAIARAPVNKRPNKSLWYKAYPPGALKASIETSTLREAPKRISIRLDIGVPYATYVIEGTHGPIVPTSREYLTLPRNPGFRKRRHFTVSGQRPNNFLSKAAAATARRHPSLRGLDHLLFRTL
jgi:hypothetical protein